MINVYKYLNLEEAVKRIGDADLVNEMLHMLNESMEQDWFGFEHHMSTHNYAEAGKILHTLKGTIPFFTDEETANVLNQMESLLKKTKNETDFTLQFRDLRVHVNGFMTDLKTWAGNERNSY